MVIGFLIVGIVTGMVSATLSLVFGFGIAFALLAYVLGGLAGVVPLLMAMLLHSDRDNDGHNDMVALEA